MPAILTCQADVDPMSSPVASNREELAEGMCRHRCRFCDFDPTAPSPRFPLRQASLLTQMHVRTRLPTPCLFLSLSGTDGRTG